MTGVFVTFRYGDRFDGIAAQKIAETAQAHFMGIPGLRSKTFTINAASREVINFYVWDSDEAAKAFFTDDRLEKITTVYGLRPRIDFVHVAALVENHHTSSSRCDG